MPVSITISWDWCLVFEFPVNGNFRLRTNSGWLSNIIVFDDEALGMCERCRPDSVWNCACLSGPGEYSLSALQGRLRAVIFRFPALLARLGVVNREKADEAFDLAVPVDDRRRHAYRFAREPSASFHASLESARSRARIPPPSSHSGSHSRFLCRSRSSRGLSPKGWLARWPTILNDSAG